MTAHLTMYPDHVVAAAANMRLSAGDLGDLSGSLSGVALTSSQTVVESVASGATSVADASSDALRRRSRRAQSLGAGADAAAAAVVVGDQDVASSLAGAGRSGAQLAR